jgi:hypothetical protein
MFPKKVSSLKERDHFGNLDVEGRIVLTRIFQKQV